MWIFVYLNFTKWNSHVGRENNYSNTNKKSRYIAITIRHPINDDYRNKRQDDEFG